MKKLISITPYEPFNTTPLYSAISRSQRPAFTQVIRDGLWLEKTSPLKSRGILLAHYGRECLEKLTNKKTNKRAKTLYDKLTKASKSIPNNQWPNIQEVINLWHQTLDLLCDEFGVPHLDHTQDYLQAPEPKLILNDNTDVLLNPLKEFSQFAHQLFLDVALLENIPDTSLATRSYMMGTICRFLNGAIQRTLTPESGNSLFENICLALDTTTTNPIGQKWKAISESFFAFSHFPRPLNTPHNPPNHFDSTFQEFTELLNLLFIPHNQRMLRVERILAYDADILAGRADEDPTFPNRLNIADDPALVDIFCQHTHSPFWVQYFQERGAMTPTERGIPRELRAYMCRVANVLADSFLHIMGKTPLPSGPHPLLPEAEKQFKSELQTQLSRHLSEDTPSLQQKQSAIRKAATAGAHLHLSLDEQVAAMQTAIQTFINTSQQNPQFAKHRREVTRWAQNLNIRTIATQALTTCRKNTFPTITKEALTHLYESILPLLQYPSYTTPASTANRGMKVVNGTLNVTMIICNKNEPPPRAGHRSPLYPNGMQEVLDILEITLKLLPIFPELRTPLIEFCNENFPDILTTDNFFKLSCHFQTLFEWALEHNCQEAAQFIFTECLPLERFLRINSLVVGKSCEYDKGVHTTPSEDEKHAILFKTNPITKWVFDNCQRLGQFFGESAFELAKNLVRDLSLEYKPEENRYYVWAAAKMLAPPYPVSPTMNTFIRVQLQNRRPSLLYELAVLLGTLHEPTYDTLLPSIELTHAEPTENPAPSPPPPPPTAFEEFFNNCVPLDDSPIGLEHPTSLTLNTPPEEVTTELATYNTPTEFQTFWTQTIEKRITVRPNFQAAFKALLLTMQMAPTDPRLEIIKNNLNCEFIPQLVSLLLMLENPTPVQTELCQHFKEILRNNPKEENVAFHGLAKPYFKQLKTRPLSLSEARWAHQVLVAQQGLGVGQVDAAFHSVLVSTLQLNDSPHPIFTEVATMSLELLKMYCFPILIEHNYQPQLAQFIQTLYQHNLTELANQLVEQIAKTIWTGGSGYRLGQRDPLLVYYRNFILPALPNRS